MNGGLGYNIGDKILVLGSDTGGTDVLNDTVITVQDINPATGEITIVNYTGAAPFLEQYNSASDTTLIIGTGMRNLNIGIGLSYVAGNPVIVAYDGANYMIGTVTVYSPITGNMYVNVTDIAGSGTYNTWSINLTFDNITGTNIIGTGSGAELDFAIGSGNPTTFDDTSMRFEAPVDIYTNTDAFDKYLVFPRRNILV